MSHGQRALVLGGTEFLGVHLVEALVAAGWDVTLFNRGVTQPDLFDSLVRLRGDRDGDVSALEGHAWDVVFDLSAFHPDQVDRTAAHLADACGHYIFVSSVSAYADFRGPGTTEEAPLGQLDGPMPAEVDGESYGPLKALCEERVTDLFASRTIIRPTVVVGPHDPSDRLTYWVLRLSEAGQHVVPPDLDSAVQYIDARDLAAWMVQLGATRDDGIYNAAADSVPFARLAQVVADVTGVELRPVQLTEEQMAAEEVRPWLDLPMWLPPADLDMRGFFQVDASRAVSAGLTTRPLTDTVRDTLKWARARDADELRFGLSRERDAELAARYGGTA
ncbi:NAD-dependent epimerase/dehydratase family protein [Cellulomonas sp. NPDC058312]|uniref:NAD-dependent epimerase/dehydratase family protein n=1 Tax=Cellulomonas sp. NPDC058312 TaxID=3346441 RepID=UPI0036E1FA8D